MLGKVVITDFGKRHFDPKFGGTKITDCTPGDFEKELNHCIETSDKKLVKILDGYAPFCKLVVIENFTNARIGTMPISVSNYQYLRHGYSSRTPAELPVLSRWFELPVPVPLADYLIVVVYSKNQLVKEHSAGPSALEPLYINGDWGVVAILGQTHPGEEPMQPITMMRNALGAKEGGSGVALDSEKYRQSVEFWMCNAIIKS